MNLRKVFAILLALLVVLSFAACDSSGSSSSDNGGTNNGGEGGNGGNGGGGDNGGNGNTEPEVTWPVSYQGDLSHVFGPGAFGYVDFREDGTYIYSDGKNGVKNPSDSDPSGSYKGDPSADGTIYLTGEWGDDSVVNMAIEISNGTFDYYGITMIRQ